MPEFNGSSQHVDVGLLVPSVQSDVGSGQEDVAWPAEEAGAWRDTDRTEYPDWYRSVIVDHRDASGLLFRRNRYSSPDTGQFTQRDPIGIAGGLNLCGYAHGDPINFSDPLGLCPYTNRIRDTSDCPKTGLGDAMRMLDKHGGAIGAQTLDKIIELEIDLQAVGQSFVNRNCGLETGGCYDEDENEAFILVDGKRTVVDIAGTVVHEVTHAMLPGNGLSIGEEMVAFDRAAHAVRGLPGASQTAAGRLSHLRFSNPTSFFNQVVGWYQRRGGYR